MVCKNSLIIKICVNDIKFVIAHGNLIEYERQKPIIHDDDIDIRFDINDFKKWVKYCSSLKNNTDIKNNLVFDDRLNVPDKQLYNGIQVRLYKFYIKQSVYEGDIYCDLTANKVIKKNSWIDYLSLVLFHD